MTLDDDRELHNKIDHLTELVEGLSIELHRVSQLLYTAVLQLNKYTKPLNTSYICTIKYNRLRIH